MDCEGCEHKNLDDTPEQERDDYCYMFHTEPEFCKLDKHPQTEQAKGSAEFTGYNFGG